MRRDVLILIALLGALIAYFTVFGSHLESKTDGQHSRDISGGPLGPVSGGLYITISPQAALQPGMQSQGTAFSLDGGRLWLTARHVVEPCLAGRYQGRVGSSAIRNISVSEAHDAALITTGPASTAAIGLSYAAIGLGTENAGYLVGFPGQRLSLVTTSLIGHGISRQGYRGGGESPVSVYAEGERIPAGYYGLGGMSGGPMINPDGNAIGILSAELPRRGRVVVARVDDWMANKTRPPGKPRTYDGSFRQIWDQASASVEDGSIAALYCSLG